jgi:hypothetical protein
MENNPKRSIYYIFYHVIFCSALRKVLLGLGLFSKKKKKLLHSLGLAYKSIRGMMTNSIDRDQWLNVTSESRDRI